MLGTGLLALLAWALQRPRCPAKTVDNGDADLATFFAEEYYGDINDHYSLDSEIIGEGAFGRVCKGIDRVTGAVRAVKAILLDRIMDKQMFEREITISQGLDHPNIIKLHEVIIDARAYYLVMDLCTGGELFDRIIEETERHDGLHAFSEEGAATYMRQIVGAMSYLHRQNVVHRDLKPENFLLESKAPDAAIKVIDFGTATRMPAKGKARFHSKVGSLYYFAPQVIQRNYDEKCDVWSCGVIAYILLCGYPPFSGESYDVIVRKIERGKFRFPSPEWDCVSRSAKDFIRQMLTFDPTKRPSAEEVLRHPWLQVSENQHRRRLTRRLSRDIGSRLRQFHFTSKIKKAALSVIAQQLEDEQIEQFRRTFQALDDSGSGVLTTAEIREGMERNRMRVPRDLEELLENLDTDGSGNIDYTEFIASMLTHREYMRPDVMWSAFKVFDQDGNGLISQQELVNVLKLGDDREVVQQVLGEVGADGDGEICFDEFCAVLKREL